MLLHAPLKAGSWHLLPQPSELTPWSRMRRAYPERDELIVGRGFLVTVREGRIYYIYEFSDTVGQTQCFLLSQGFISMR